MLRALGVHPVEASEPVFLIRVESDMPFDTVDWESITRPRPGEPRSNWQVPYDEQALAILPTRGCQAVFFFHYLDVTRPLEYAEGPVALPMPTAIPKELAGVEYFEP